MKRIFLSLIFSLVFAGTALAAELPEADPAAFAGKTIGVLTGSVQEQWAATEFPDAKLAYFSNSPDGVLALEAGKIDALFFSDVPLRYTIGERTDLEILAAGAGEIPVAPIFGKNEKGDKLRAQFNEYLAGIKADGTLEKMEKKWVDGPEEVREFYDPSEPPDVNGKITVITQSGTAPFGYLKNGVMYGCEIELVREFCRKYGYQPVFFDANFDGAVMGVHTGKYDMGAAALMITEERAKSVNFGEPAFCCRGALLVKRGEVSGTGTVSGTVSGIEYDEAGDLPPAKLSEFDGKRIGVQPGSIAETVASQNFKDPELYYFATLPDGICALENGKIDTFMSDEPMLRYVASTRNDMTVLRVGEDIISQAPVFSKSEKGDRLRAEYNAFLAKCFENGTIAQLEKKWIDGKEEGRVTEPCELPDINGTLTIAIEAAYAPMEYIKDGRISGFEVELIQEFCREYGYRPDFLNTAFESIIMGVSVGRFDMGAACFTVTEERKKSVNFGDPFLQVHNAAIVRKDGGWTGASAPDESGTLQDGASPENQGILQSVREGFHRTFIEEDRWKLFISGMGVTFLITVLSVVLGTAAGFGLYLLCRNGNRAANGAVNAVNWFVTGMPLVVFLMVLFYIVFAKTSLSGTVVAIIGFTVVFALTTFQLVKNGEAAVDPGQKEAACALGYSDMGAFLRIILPQAALHFLPPYQDEIVSLIKATAVVGYITVMDVTKIGDIIRGRTYDAVFPLLAVVIAYFVLSAALKAAVRVVMKKADTKNRPQREILKGAVIR